MSKRKIVYPSQKEVMEWFEYRDDGVLINKKDRGRNGCVITKKDEVAGGFYKGRLTRRQIKFQNQNSFASVLIWIYHYGAIAGDLIVDHISCKLIADQYGVHLDDRIDNLQLLTHEENNLKKTPQPTNTGELFIHKTSHPSRKSAPFKVNIPRIILKYDTQFKRQYDFPSLRAAKDFSAKHQLELRRELYIDCYINSNLDMNAWMELD